MLDECKSEHTEWRCSRQLDAVAVTDARVLRDLELDKSIENEYIPGVAKEGQTIEEIEGQKIWPGHEGDD